MLGTADSVAVEIPDTLDYLLGTWTVRRTIADHRAGLDGTFEGTATVGALGPPERRAATARYEEVGRMRIGDHDGAATRALRYTRRPDGAVTVEFADGRPFVVCDLRAGRWEAAHPCAPDHYRLRYRVRSSDVLEEHWRVRGPSKDYEAWTTLERQLLPGPGRT